MAQLITTGVTGSLSVTQNNFVRLGTAYFSSGGTYMHASQNAYFNGSAWVGDGGTLQLSLDGTGGSSRFLYATAPRTSSDYPFIVESATTSMGSTTTTFVKSVAGNTTTNSTIGIGAAAGANAGDGKLLINAGGASKPILEVTNCAGNSSTNSSFYTSFKGWLAIKVGNDVAGSTPGGTAIVAGTYYIRLWG